MKKFSLVTGIILGLLTLLFFIVTDFVDHTAYFESAYFKNSLAVIDDLDRSTFSVNDRVQAGFAKISITPSLKHDQDDPLEGEFAELPLAGYGARKGAPSTGVHDSLFVKAVALNVGQQTLVFVSADLLIMPPTVIDSASAFLSKKGISRSQLIFSATHTHSGIGAWGPGYVGKQFAGNENKNLQRWLVSQISQAVVSSVADLKPATIGSGTFQAGAFTRNRLIGGLETTNDDFAYLVVEQAGHRKAVIGSFSAHATTLGAENMEISADYPGYWQRKMEATTADLALFFAGSMGSQSPVGEGNGFDKARMIGEALADSLNIHLRQAALTDQITLASVSLKMQLPRYHIRLTNKLNLSTSLSNKLMPVPGNVYLQAVRIGNLVWISTPADFSGEYALQLKHTLAAKGFTANVSSFNGSYVGYIIPGRYFYLNKYEPKTMGWFGPYMGDYTMNLINRITQIVTKPQHH
ncbi:neutral/alkaline non-lysosomal ceramidase N-terminal domain-containing protein [Gaoshiqia sp. Z1-71]|uniref:neutral/alkaline non-lysosomal ceramidase N-terminal domain-containing protein n=1 Tax=Gaoshiqia hydrogeniformans TaxID=3290090 RepID=UPI003BF7A0DC